MIAPLSVKGAVGQGFGNCVSACDFDGQDGLGLVDALGLLAFLFVEGAPPAAPFPDCDVEVFADCDSYACP